LKITSRLVSWLAVLSPKAVTAEDMLDRFGPTSPVGRQFISWCYDLYQTYSTDGLVNESFDVWRGLYKEATNLDENAKIAIAKFASNMGISKPDAERFLFAVETYIAVLMKLIVGEVLVQKNVATALSLRGLLGTDMVDGYKELHHRLAVLRSLFEEDIFDWFLEPARKARSAYVQAKMNLGDVVDALDNLDFGNIKTDLIRDLYHGFFDPDTRKALGEFYTKDEIVDEILDFLKYDDKTIKKITSEDKVLVDASCGSGTFLVRAIARWKNEINSVSSDPSKSANLLRKITDNIIGIDIHPFAVTMARVNYLLAIADLLSPNIANQMPEVIIPIYWTDSLVMREAIVPRIDKGLEYRPVEIQIPVLGKFILPRHDHIDWEILATNVRNALDNNWSENRFLEEFPEDKRLAYRDLLTNLYKWFGERKKAGKNGRWISVLKNSITVYKLQGKCSYVVGNPPWVRIHNIDISIRESVRKNFSFYKTGWTPNLLKTRARFKEQYDYCMAFVESGLKLLDEDGELGFVITSKVMQSLYAGSMRKNLLEKTKILYLKDYSLSEIQLFRDATNYPLILVVKKMKPSQNKTHISVVVKGKIKSWELKQEELPVIKNDHMAPWLMAPPDVIRAFRKMQILEHEKGFTKNPLVGDLYEISMGVKTSANDIFLVKKIARSATPGLIVATTEGDENIVVEEELLYPFVRGEDISQFSYSPGGYIIWTHDANGEVLKKLPNNAERYFLQNETQQHLKRRADYRKNMPIWTIFRVSKGKLQQKAAWHRLSKRMNAVVLPKTYDDKILGSRNLIVIQTVYFISSADSKLCARIVVLMNSTPVRTFIKSFAERASGGYYEHLSWTVGLLPMPKSVYKLPVNLRGQEEIDEAISKAYSLTSEETKAINDYYDFVEKEVVPRK
jgi:type I restriction-modification system DNA methylase subunit